MAEFEKRQSQNQESSMVRPTKPDRDKTRLAYEKNRLTGHQQVLGNQAVKYLLNSQVVQAKLKKGALAASNASSVPSTGIYTVTEKEIGKDLKKAKSWAEVAAKKMNRYAKLVKRHAEYPKMAYKIRTMQSGRGEVHGLYCALLDNFNVNPETDKPIYYACRILTINDRLKGINNTLKGLKHSNFRNLSLLDKRCEKSGAFVINESLPIYLCTGFWMNHLQRPATIIHEVAHLRGMDDEQYIQEEGEKLPTPDCRIESRFSIGVDQTVKNPDSYAFFCADLRSKEKPKAK